MRNFLYKIPRKNFNLAANAQKFALPKLDYEYDALEPIFSKELLELHHSKHHQTYIDTYNNLVVEFAKALEQGNVQQMESMTKDLNFNAGSHFNHSMFWKNLAPVKSKNKDFI